ncbi:RDD family protein [Nitrosophilus kaiyonis]|uniref:RDD family protein n=1 Tax=Nitrosophilus kaiyonis TaxID=2930200 RepID=UPI00248FB897|nr:RDD family protein [Nitrosophilus kaiyonis]
MPRWRDVKHKKIKKNIEKKEEISFIPASIPDRLKAFLTDTFMITMPILYIVIYLVMGSREEFKSHMGEGWLYILIPHLLIVTSFWSFKGQTPGMKAYDIKIVNKAMKNPNIFQSIIRYFLMQISIFSIIGILLALFRKDKQTLHDILSFTYMIKSEDEID